MVCIDPSWRPELALNLEQLGLAAQTVLGRGGLLENQEVNAPLDVADGRQMASRPRPCVPFALSRPGTPGQGSALHGLRLAPLTSSEPLRTPQVTTHLDKLPFCFWAIGKSCSLQQNEHGFI